MTAVAATTTCDPAVATTRSLLGWGAVAGPFYVVVSLAQALTRDGFDLARHPWSVLENGPLGWIQSANLVLTGALVVAFALGLRRAIGAGWAPRLLAAYGVTLAGAGIFTADPVAGFPAGSPGGVLSWHGTLHFLVGGIGFACMIAACLVLGRRFARAGERRWARASRVTGIAFLAAFAGITTGSPAATLPFVAGVVLSFGWLAGLAVHLYKTV
ncbi:MAG TPA: DUF998 domain-containing protein [Mycobacteriales bacterium]|jgi:hypothetical membrane protein|nr:DUF998 domain-containing protein [Mycobacteriales bacterium]